MRINIFYITFILVILRNGTSLATPPNENVTCMMDRELEQQCGSYTYKVVKPLLDYIRQIKDELVKSELREREIMDLKEKLVQHDAVIKELRSQNKNLLDFQQTLMVSLITNSKTTENCDKFKMDLSSKTEKLILCQNEIKTHNSTLIEKDNEIISLNVKAKNESNELKTTQLKLEESETKLISCKINVNNIEKLEVCQNQLKAVRSTIIKKDIEINSLNVKAKNEKNELKTTQLKLEESQNKLVSCKINVNNLEKLKEVKYQNQLTCAEVELLQQAMKELEAIEEKYRNI